MALLCSPPLRSIPLDSTPVDSPHSSGFLACFRSSGSWPTDLTFVDFVDVRAGWRGPRKTECTPPPKGQEVSWGHRIPAREAAQALHANRVDTTRPPLPPQGSFGQPTPLRFHPRAALVVVVDDDDDHLQQQRLASGGLAVQMEGAESFLLGGERLQGLPGVRKEGPSLPARHPPRCSRPGHGGP